MKIHSIRLMNLNSLQGEHHIDFTEPPLSDSGIFGIVGPTGSGKTTLLDAVTLALYGKTPRLTSGVDELMTRHTGESYAEVEFEVRAGRFRSRWERKRARGAPDGRLQPVRMELVDLEANGEVLETKIKEVTQRVEALTGLNFERFTRSILLAQGQFNAFLNADDRERAELLERMTGTEVYSRISTRVFETFGNMNKQIASDEKSLDRFDILPDEELALLAEQSKTFKAQVKQLRDQHKQLDAQRVWREIISQLEADIQKQKERLATLTDRYAREQDKLDRLERDEKALPLAPAFEKIRQRESRLAEIQAERSALEKNQTRESEHQAKLSEQLKVHEETQEVFKAKKQQRLKDIQATRKLDDQLAQIQTDLNQVDQERAALENTHRDTQEQQQTLMETIAGLQGVLKQSEIYLDQNKGHGELEKESSIVQDRLQTLAQRRLDRVAIRQNITDNNDAQSALEKRRAQTAKETEAADQRIQTVRTNLHSLQEAAADQSGEDEFDTYQDLQQACDQREAAGRNLLEAAESYAALSSQFTQTEAEIQGLDGNKALQEQQRKALDEQAEFLKATMNQLREQRNLRMQQASLSEHRQHLEEGIACPLCGSLDHPYAEHLPDDGALHDIDQELKETDQRLKEAEKKRVAMGEQLSQSGESLAGLRERQKGIREERSALVNRFTEQSASQGITIAIEQIDKLKEFQADAYREKIEMANRIEAIREHQRQRRALETNLRTEEDQLTRLALAATELEGEQKRLAAERTDLDRRIDENTEGVKKLEGELTKLLGLAAIRLPGAGDETAVMEEVSTLAEAFATHRKQLDQARQGLAEQKPGQAAVNEHMRQLEKELKQKTKDADSKRATLKAQASEREKLLGDADPDAEEQRLAEEEETNEQARTETRQAAAETKTRVEELARQLIERTGQQDENQKLLEKELTAFEENVRSKDFADLDEYRTSLLDEETRKAWKTLRAELDREHQEVKTILDDRSKQYAKEIQAALTEADLPEIQQALAEAAEKLEAEEKQLRDSEVNHETQVKARAQQSAMIAAIQEQRTLLEKWRALNGLIGSADGNKYRTFVQGLTLEILVQLANQHLLMLNPRYRLARSQDESLGLEVVDTYQADARRSTRTLSGGESFLASLSLALGLSDLAARNVSIDSLFLDEGFGTLDAETLETALSALDSLHASGKMIGIISHIEELKERVPVQIQLIPKAGGLSVIKVRSNVDSDRKSFDIAGVTAESP